MWTKVEDIFDIFFQLRNHIEIYLMNILKYKTVVSMDLYHTNHLWKFHGNRVKNKKLVYDLVGKYYILSKTGFKIIFFKSIILAWKLYKNEVCMFIIIYLSIREQIYIQKWYNNIKMTIIDSK